MYKRKKANCRLSRHVRKRFQNLWERGRSFARLFEDDWARKVPAQTHRRVK
jgi:hypothetical protein